MIHPKTELRFINSEVGYGVVAIDFIPKGTITWALDNLDREFTQSQFDEMLPLYQNILDKYSFRNNRGNLILCWDIARYVNHSFNANCLTTAYDFEIAIRDIYEGEQLTDDYGYLNIAHPFEAIDEGTDRKVVYPDDLVNYHSMWDQQLLETWPYIIEVDQPLREIIPQHIWAKVENITGGQEKMDSILKCYYPG